MKLMPTRRASDPATALRTGFSDALGDSAVTRAVAPRRGFV
jgi:hypothetical protein